MNFLRNIKPIKLRFYTENAGAYACLKPDHAKAFVPKWLSTTEVIPNKTNVKYCYGLRESFRRGFSIPLWTDIKIQTSIDEEGNLDGNLIFADSVSGVIVEEGNSVMHTKDRHLFKLLSPWYCECDEDITFTAFENHFSKPVRNVEFVSGILQFKYSNATHMFIYVENKTQNILLEAGDTPILYRQNSDRDIEIQVEYDPEKTLYLQKLGANTPFFSHRMAKFRKFGRNNK